MVFMRPQHRCSILVGILDHAREMGTFADAVEAAYTMYPTVCVYYTSVVEDEYMDLGLVASELGFVIKGNLLLSNVD